MMWCRHNEIASATRLSICVQLPYLRNGSYLHTIAPSAAAANPLSPSANWIIQACEREPPLRNSPQRPPHRIISCHRRCRYVGCPVCVCYLLGMRRKTTRERTNACMFCAVPAPEYARNVINAGYNGSTKLLLLIVAHTHTHKTNERACSLLSAVRHFSGARCF